MKVVGLTGSQWKCLCQATGLADAFREVGERLQLDLNDEGNRFLAREEISAVLEPWFRARISSH